MKKPRSLRSRLILLLLMVTALPMLFFAVFSQLRLNDALEESLDGRIQAGLERANQSLTVTLEKYETILYDLCTDDEIVQIVEKINAKQDVQEAKLILRRELKHICNRNEGVEGMAVFLDDGSYIYYDRLASSSVQSNWIDTDMNQPMEGVMQIQPVRYAGEAGDERVNLFSIQRKIIDYRDIYKTIGVIVINVNERMLQKALYSQGDDIYYLEKDGVVLSAPRGEQVGQAAETLRRNFQRSREGKTYRLVCMQNEESGWTVMEYYPLSLYKKTLWEQMGMLLWFSGGLVIMMVLAVILVTRPVISSVDSVVIAMQKVKNGDFSVRVSKNAGMPAEVQEISDGFNEMVEQTQQLIGQVRQSALEQKNAEISALEAQIDPHFLYNTLDTINWKALDKGEVEISELVGDLGDILRYAIKNAGGITTLGQEIAWLKKYMRLQQEKLGQEVQIFCDIPGNTANCSMHKLLLQPFVENSIKHGMHGLDRVPILLVTARYGGGTLAVTIEDNGKGMSAETAEKLNQTEYHMQDHFGIENVRKRLKLYYGDKASLHFESREGEFTRVHLYIPVEKCEKKF